MLVGRFTKQLLIFAFKCVDDDNDDDYTDDDDDDGSCGDSVDEYTVGEPNLFLVKIAKKDLVTVHSCHHPLIYQDQNGDDQNVVKNT